MTTHSRQFSYDLDDRLEPDPDAPPVRAASVIRSSPAPTAVRPRRTQIIESPIDREFIDYVAPIFWLLAALIALGISGISTVRQLGALAARAGLTVPPLQMAIIGLVVALMIAFGEFVTSEKHRRAYLILLAVDVALTLSWSWSAFYTLASSFGATPQIAIGFSLIVGGGLSVICAWLPERVALGARRRGYRL